MVTTMKMKLEMEMLTEEMKIMEILRTMMVEMAKKNKNKSNVGH
jgi:hypothetical protein